MNEHRPGPRSRPASTLLLGAALALALPICAQDSASFRTELRAISSAQARDPKQAKQQLSALLEKHKDADYVRHARDELVELDRRLAFASSYTPPKLQSLISGKIVTYKATSGRIKLIYTRRTLGDFDDPNKPKPVKPAKKPRTPPGTLQLPTIEMPELEGERPYRPRIHPAMFRSCKIQIEGSQYEGTEILTGIDSNGMFRTFVGEPPRFGRYRPTSIARQVGGEPEQLFVEKWLPKRAPKRRDKKPPKSRWPVAWGEPYSCRIEMASKSIKLRIGKKTITQQRWSKPAIGSIGFFDTKFDTLTIEGQIEPAWIEGLFDNHYQDAVQAHQKRYLAKAELPGWIFTEPTATSSTAKPSSRRWYPGKEEPKELKAVREVLEDLRKGRSTRVLIRLAMWKDGYVPSIVKQYLLSYAHLVDGSPSKSLALGQQVLAADPEFADAHLILGYDLMALGQFEAAADSFRQVLRRQPTHPSASRDLATAFLRQRKPEEAWQVLEDAIARGVNGDRVQAMRRRIERVLNGPAFAKRFTVKTPHYEITSDIDEATCKSAGKVLEAALAYYCKMLGNVRDKFAEGQRFRVFLFASEQGYKRYLEGLQLSVPVHTAGLYSSELQQLLIWNLPSRTDMLRTIRHEGFHQYFDLLADDAPVWFNEGLAEYFEVSRFRAGTPSAGIVQPRHVRSLALIRSRGSLESFVKILPRRFYGSRASLNYSQSWAFVRYLRRGTPSVRAVFDRLIKALASGERREAALAKAFDGVDMEQLSRGFWKSVDKLKAK